jgi:hypothetical protein
VKKSKYIFTTDTDNQQTKEFFEEIVNNFMKESFSFYEKWDFLPFIHSKQQIGSAMIPAIHKETHNVWLQQPYMAKDKQKLLDISTIKSKNVYLIETTHSFNNPNNTISTQTIDKWNSIIDETSQMTIENNKSFVEFYGYKGHKVILMVLPTVVRDKEDLEVSKMSAKEYANYLKEAFSTKVDSDKIPTQITTYKLDNPNKYEHYFDDNQKEIYPFVNFILKIEEISLGSD